MRGPNAKSNIVTAMEMIQAELTVESGDRNSDDSQLHGCTTGHPLKKGTYAVFSSATVQ